MWPVIVIFGYICTHVFIKKRSKNLDKKRYKRDKNKNVKTFSQAIYRRRSFYESVPL